MVSKLIVALFLCMALLLSSRGLSSTPLQTDKDFIENTYFPAVTLLYAQDESGTMKMRCTATAFEKVDSGYLFASAAHCATDIDTESREKLNKIEFFITPDEKLGTKTFVRATIVACGYRDEGDDFCVFYVKTTQSFPLVTIGVDSYSLAGEEVVNVASPEGLGKQVFFGRITMPRLDRSIVIDDLNWSHTVLLQLPGTNGGSSGSAIVCLNQHAVCAFLVGTIGGTTIVGIPVSKFKLFLDNVKSCQSKKYVVEKNTTEDAFSYHCPEEK